MSMNKILIIVDRTDKKQVALSRGLELAKAMAANVEAVCFTHEYLKTAADKSASQTKLKDHLIKANSAWLDEQLAQLDYQDIKITPKVVWSKQLYQWITKRCQQQEYLAVVKTVNRSDSFYHTSTDWHLLRECPAPVMLAAEKKWRKSHPILASVDIGSRKKSKQKLNQQILEIAADYACKLNSELHIVHSIYISTVLQDLDLINRDAVAKKRKAELKPVIEKLCSKYGLSKQQIHIRTGLAHKAIPSVASKIKADLVVMGTASSHGLATRLIGNTAEKVLNHLRTDVLAIKPEK